MMTILSSDGHIIFSTFGTKALFIPEEAVVASSGSLWKLSSDGSTIMPCSPAKEITEAEIINCLKTAVIYHTQNPKPSTVISERNPTVKIQKAMPSSNVTKGKRTLNKTITNTTNPTNTIQSFLKKSPKSHQTVVPETMDIDTDDEDDVLPSLPKQSPQSQQAIIPEKMDIDTNNDDDILPSELPYEENSTPEPIPMSHYVIEESDSNAAPTPTASISANPAVIPTSNPTITPSTHDSYCGPTDKVIKSSCMVISGFHCSIKNNGEIAKATHAIMNASHIRHKLTPETNKNIKPVFHTSPNVCGYFPLELNEEYSFSRYPSNQTEKQIYQQ